MVGAEAITLAIQEGSLENRAVLEDSPAHEREHVVLKPPLVNVTALYVLVDEGTDSPPVSNLRSFLHLTLVQILIGLDSLQLSKTESIWWNYPSLLEDLFQLIVSFNEKSPRDL